MNRWLRHHGYALGVAFRRLRQHPFSSLANIVVIALMLAVPILGASVLQSSQPLARQLAVTPELTLFLKAGTPPAAQQALLARVREEAGDRIAQARLMPRDRAMAQLRADPTWARALDALPENPLPDALIVTLRDSDAPARVAAELAQAWRQWPEIEEIQLDSEWVRRLESLLTFVRLGLGMLAGAVVIVVLATVFNTVRLQALTQREEIAVARLVGATESFVRRPFLYLGALSGGLAATVAIAIAAVALRPLNQALAALARSYGTDFALRLPDAGVLALSVLGVAVLGALSARWSVTRNTRF